MSGVSLLRSGPEKLDALYGWVLAKYLCQEALFALKKRQGIHEFSSASKKS